MWLFQSSLFLAINVFAHQCCSCSWVLFHPGLIDLISTNLSSSSSAKAGLQSLRTEPTWQQIMTSLWCRLQVRMSVGCVLCQIQVTDEDFFWRHLMLKAKFNRIGGLTMYSIAVCRAVRYYMELNWIKSIVMLIHRSGGLNTKMKMFQNDCSFHLSKIIQRLGGLANFVPKLCQNYLGQIHTVWYKNHKYPLSSGRKILMF